MLVNLLDHPRRIWLFILLVCAGLLSFGMYLQHVVGLIPCPMCIVQRYAMVLMALVALMGAVLPGRKTALIAGSWLVLLAGGGAYVAARQTWLQWYPPEVVSCGRDFYGMIETFPLQRAIPMIFKGGGDCSKVDWTFFGGSIAVSPYHDPHKRMLYSHDGNGLFTTQVVKLPVRGVEQALRGKVERKTIKKREEKIFKDPPPGVIEPPNLTLMGQPLNPPPF